MSGGPGSLESGLFVINGEKALMAAIGAVFGAYPLVQHRRNNWEFPGHRPPPIHFQRPDTWLRMKGRETELPPTIL